MLSSKSRPITRARPSLSCYACRQRKVKCGKQKPECEACIKLGGSCVYNSNETQGHSERDGRINEKRGRKDSTEDENSVTPHDERIAEVETSISDPQSVVADAQSILTNQSSTSHTPIRGSRIEDTISNGRDKLQRIGPHSPQRKSFDNYKRGHLSVKQPIPVRHVETTFWAYIKGQEADCDGLLTEQFSDYWDGVVPLTDTIGIKKLLELLPHRCICDALLRSFRIGVYPVLPLVHIPTLMLTYNSLWDFCEKPEEMPHSSLLLDPSSLCLFFAVIYCGAKSLHPSQWLIAPFEGLERESFTERLNSMYQSCLKACRCSVNPTLNSLTALILGESCSRPEPECLANMGHVSMMTRVAQYLGLHSESQGQSFSEVERELRLRIWWHILTLDYQCTITAGASSCTNDGDMIRGLRKIRGFNQKSEPTSENSQDSSSGNNHESLSMLFSIGRFESTRISQLLVSYMHGPSYLVPKNLGKMIEEIKSFNEKIDALLSCIPSKGLPEKGFILMRVANATPMTQPDLYKDKATEASVFGSWVRIMLSLLRLDAAILLQKQFLGYLEQGTEQEFRIWGNIARCCCAYLRNFLQLLQVPSFTPYKWFYPNRHPPCQSMFVVLSWLKRFSNRGMASLVEMSLYLTDEVLDIYASDIGQMPVAGEPSLHSGRKVAQEWQMLKALRNTVEAGATGINSSTNPQTRQIPEGSASHINLSELDAWSTSFAQSLHK